MGTYDSVTDRDGAQALMPEDVATEILGTVAEESAVMQLGRRLPNMSRAQRRLPVWASLPHAYFVNGDTGLKQTTNVSWDNVYINAEEIACIVPIPDAVLDDADYDLWEQARPAIVSAIGKVVDQAILYGINAPSDWPDPIAIGADEAGHVVTIGDVGDLYDDLLGEGGVLSYIEEDGYMATGHVSALSMRAKYRGVRDNEGQPIFVTARQEGRSTYALDGEPLLFPKNGAIDPRRSLLISGEWDQLVWSVRQDITYKILTEAVITNEANEIVYNLAQQDMTALRVVFRMGWALPNPINLVNEDPATRYPFAILQPESAS